MSHKGFTQHICENHHYYTHYEYESDYTCQCGAKDVWANSVDSDMWGYVYVGMLEIRSGYYRVPDHEETEIIRTYHSHDGSIHYIESGNPVPAAVLRLQPFWHLTECATPAYNVVATCVSSCHCTYQWHGCKQSS